MNARVLQQIRQTSAALNVGRPYILAMASAIRTAAIRSAKSDTPLYLKNISTSAANDQFTGLLVYSYLRQYGEFDTLGGRVREVELSAYSRLNRDIGSELQIDVGTLSKQLSKLADRSTRESLHVVKRRINAVLQESARIGESRNRRVARLSDALERMGVTPNRPTYLKTLVNTHISIARGTAQRVRVLSDDDVINLMYVTVGDDRVRAAHSRLHGLVKPKFHPIWETIWTPNGYNCRCEIVPVSETTSITRLPRNAARMVDEGFDFDFLELAA